MKDYSYTVTSDDKVLYRSSYALHLSACLSFHSILSYNLKMYYFRDNYAFLRVYFKVDYSH